MPAIFQDIPIAGGDTGFPGAIGKRLKALNPYLEFQSGRLLDCGCGSGAYVAAIGEHFGLDTHGIEHDFQKVAAAWDTRGLKERVTQGDLQALKEPDAEWDFALLNEVLEHVPDDRAALAEVYRVLKPGGRLFIFSPNRLFPFETHGVYWKKSGQPVPHWLPLVPYVPLALGRQIFRYWARNYWPSELGKLVESVGFKLTNRSYIGVTFENISGRQPRVIKAIQPLLRRVSNTLEKCPGLRCFGVSQLLVCRK